MELRITEPATEAYRFPLTIRHLLDGVLIRAHDQLIVYRDQASYSYSELIERIGRLASLLEGIGGTKGMTVAVLDWDSHRYLEAYFAVPMSGAVLQTVNVRLPVPQIAYTLKHAKAEILLVHHDFFPIVDAILPMLPDVKAVVAIMDGNVGTLPEWAIGEYEELSAIASPDYPFQDFDENAVATTFYTTGTTGNPKGVCFTHRQLVLHTLVATAPFGATPGSPGLSIEDVYMPLTPMFHVHAWGVPYIATMLGLKQVYPGRYEPAMICRLREEHRVTYSHCVPTILELVLQAADQTGTDLTGWKMTIGGSALTKALCGKARQYGMDVGAGYGMSETAPMIAKAVRTAAPHEASEDEMLSMMTVSGNTTPLVSARIVDEAMNDVPHDGTTRGELVLRAPWLTGSYSGDAAASQALWRGGWMHTQDIATIDKQGRIQIRDRLKDVIKSGGEWIDSIHLEELVASVEGVVEAAVIAVPDVKWGERPLAIVVSRPGINLTLDMVNAPIVAAIEEGEITRYAKLHHYESISQLPKTSVGKIDKKALRARFGDAMT